MATLECCIRFVKRRSNARIYVNKFRMFQPYSSKAIILLIETGFGFQGCGDESATNVEASGDPGWGVAHEAYTAGPGFHENISGCYETGRTFFFFNFEP